jgi:hydrogenase expression/formation protein HypE
MAKLPEIGKISPEVFTELIFPRLGAVNKNILVGPQHGVDVGIVRIGDRAVAMTSDPVFIVPEYGFQRAAWFATHILASDVVTSGLPPTYLTIDLNLPMSMTEVELTEVWETIHEESKKMGMAIVCGHTARYDNCQYPMVGGATVLAEGGLDEYVTPKFIKSGDRIIITKGPAIEAVGIFSAMFPKYIARKFGADFGRKSEKIFYKMSVVKEARAAVRIGVRDNGISSMHDATECGIWGGIYEVARAANLGARVEKEKIVIEDCVPEICGLFRIDPYKSISEGTLIITCRETKSDQLIRLLSREGIKASVCGEMVELKKGMTLVADGREQKLEHPIVDPFWKAFYDALQDYQKLEV